jgi:hypothetical protein
MTLVNGSRRSKARKARLRLERHAQQVLAGIKATGRDLSIPSCMAAFETAYGFKSERASLRARTRAYAKPDYVNRLEHGAYKAPANNTVILAGTVDGQFFDVSMYAPTPLGKRADVTQEQLTAPRPTLRLKRKDGTTRGIKAVFSKS